MISKFLKYFKNIDLFATTISLSFKKKQQYSTWIGTLVSIFIIIIFIIMFVNEMIIII